MKLATWNVNSLRVRLPHVLEWLAQTRVDVLGLQETKLIDEKFPREDIETAGYHVVFAGQPASPPITAWRFWRAKINSIRQAIFRSTIRTSLTSRCGSLLPR